ncbi:MAG: NTP transferase domain-containing protein [Candidatus Baltobacteraceae bacterium]
MTYCAVITAGGRVDGPFAAAIGTDVKALARIRGTTMLEAAIESLRGAGVERIAVVGGAQARQLTAARIERFIPETANGAANQRLALRAWGPESPLLYLTSDMPYIGTRPLQEFLRRVPPDSLAVPLTEHADFVRRFPGAPPFGITLDGEKVVNGGVFAIPSGAGPLIEGLSVKLFDARKRPVHMVRLAGLPLLLRFLLGRLSVRHAETHAQRLLGIPACAVRGASPELAYDVDNLPEYRYAAAHA